MAGTVGAAEAAAGKGCMGGQDGRPGAWTHAQEDPGTRAGEEESWEEGYPGGDTEQQSWEEPETAPSYHC